MDLSRGQIWRCGVCHSDLSLSDQGLANFFSVKGHVVNIVGFADHMSSVVSTHSAGVA